MNDSRKRSVLERLETKLEDGVVAVYDGLRGNRILAVTLALALVAVPTTFAIFPHITDVLSRPDREGVMVAWIVAAVFTGIAAQTEKIETTVQARTTQAILLRQYLTLLINPGQSKIPDNYAVSIYLEDGDGYLLPWFPSPVFDRNDPSVFRSGCGATGKCYLQGEPQVMVGDAVSSAEHGLSPDQQERFAGYEVVAAVPVYLTNEALVGAATVISVENDGTFGTPEGDIRQEGIFLLEEVADKVGEALSMEGLEWFT